MNDETVSEEDLSFNDVYYIPATGGIHIEQHFGTILLSNTNTLDLDLTLALQLKVNVRTFNEKLGIIKDASNDTIIQSTFDSSNNSFQTDDILFNYQDFIPYITTDNVISVGGFSTIYRDFKRSIINYYEHADNVSLFNQTSKNILDEPEFTKNDFVNIFTTINLDGGYDVSGQLHIYRISNILNQLYNNDPFDNRTNKTYENGFIAGDLISLTDGITIQLHLLSKVPNPIDDINYTPDNEPPPILLSKIYRNSLVLHLENL